MLHWFTRQNEAKQKEMLESEEYSKLSKRITELESNVLALVLDMDTFRNKVMRAYQRKRDQEEPVQQERKIGQPIRK